jgi:hypothetical protein
MGAAAVFETAAEIPPTGDKQSVHAIRPEMMAIACASMPEVNYSPAPMAGAMLVKTYSRSRPRSPARMLAAVRKIAAAIKARLAVIHAIAQFATPSHSVVAMLWRPRAVSLRWD